MFIFLVQEPKKKKKKSANRVYFKGESLGQKSFQDKPCWFCWLAYFKREKQIFWEQPFIAVR